MTWDNGDRTVLVNPELGGVTLGWKLTHTAQDELFAAIEGTAFHTRVILERMEEHGVPIHRVINGGGIPQKNETLNRVYANVLNKPVLVPQSRSDQPRIGDLRVSGGRDIQDDRRGAGGAVPEISRRGAGSGSRTDLRGTCTALYRKLYFGVRQAGIGSGRGGRCVCRRCGGSRRNPGVR